MLDLSCAGKVALVTGGSRGIGRAAAIALAGVGARVSIGYRANVELANAVVAEIRAAGGEAIATATDVSTAEGCEALHAATVAGLGKVDILVNCAGSHDNEVFMLLKDEQFEYLYAEHVLSVVRLTRLVGNAMLARRWGRIINISSVGATYPGVGQANYAAAKGAVESLTGSLAVEFAKRHVTVNCVSPGLVDTDMAKDTNIDTYVNLQLVKRLGKPEEIAAWIVMLASRYGEMMTGQVFTVDGGYRLA